MERFLRWNKNLEDKNRIMRCSGYMHKVQKSAGRNDTLMKLATDANKPGQLYDIKFQFKRKSTNKEKSNWLNNWVIEAEQDQFPTQSRDSSFTYG